jgi:hypothetical protein
MKTQNNQIEQYYYIALVLKGSEKQYLSLLNLLNNPEEPKILYQKKSLTYLRVVENCEKREDAIKSAEEVILQ